MSAGTAETAGTAGGGGGTVRIRGAEALRGTLCTPGDKSISHRALILGSLGEGTSVIRGLSDGDDVRRTARAVSLLGAGVERTTSPFAEGPPGGPAGPGEPAGPGGTPAVEVHGGRGRLAPPGEPIDCGNSGTAMRLLAGVAASLPGTTALVGDASLSSRPMDRIAAPLAAMGASVEGRGERCLPPLEVRGGHLHGVEWTPPVASAQVKSAVLLAGLGADGETVVHEPVRTRSHTEELLARAGADVSVEDGAGGRTIRLRASKLLPLDLTVPGDPSQAAWWLVAACLVPGSEVTVRDVYAGPERIGFVRVLERMGAAVEVTPTSPGVAHLAARASGRLRATTVEATEIPSLDEVPVLAVAAAAAQGTTRFVGVGELRVKESDRLSAVVRLVRALGAGAEVAGPGDDELVIHGTEHLRHARTDSGGDHRMAMAAAVAALAAGSGESQIDGWACVATSYPTFLADLVALGGAARVRLIAIDGPAGSGKSTVSKALAARLGIERLDTGAMYRSVAWAALERGVDPKDAAGVTAIARASLIEVAADTVVIDGVDVTSAIRTPAVNRAVSLVAAIPGVRAALVERQRAWAGTHGGGVVEGRDIGTVVFPGADLKVFLTAAPEERARRRHDEAAEGLARRDHIDSTRTASPMAVADDARVLDTTGRSVEAVVAEILSWM